MRLESGMSLYHGSYAPISVHPDYLEPMGMKRYELWNDESVR